MIAKIVTTLFFGSIIGLIPIAIFFAGIHTNYLQAQEIKEYFNPFFADHVNGWTYGAFVLVFGYGLFAAHANKLFYALYGLTLFVSFLMFIPVVGFEVGDMLLSKKDQTLHNDLGKPFVADVLYEGRDNFYYKRAGSKKIEVKKK